MIGKSDRMELRLIMADPAGNRTAIVRTPVPAELRAETAAKIMKIQELRAEQVGFKAVPRLGGAGRLEMMGGEFCGNAARSFGFLCFSERQAALSAGNSGGSPASGAGGSILIEISGSRGLLRVDCDPRKGTAFSEMPMPERIEYSGEGFPLIISEGIAHMVIEDMEPDSGLIHRMIERWGRSFDAFGLQFLKGDTLIPVVYVGASESLVYESSCGSGSLAAAWYLEKKAHGSQRQTAQWETGSPGTYRFREPGGEIIVHLYPDENGEMHGTMGGGISLEEEILLNLPD